MKFRYNKSAKSSTIHLDDKDQAIKLASKILAVATSRSFNERDGSTIAIFEDGPKVQGKQQYAHIGVMAGSRRNAS